MSKRHSPLAGARPQFNSGSFQATTKKVRVTGKQVTAKGNLPLRTLNYESRPAKNGRTNNMVYQADCECPGKDVIPSQDTLEKAANDYIYGSKVVADSKRSRDYHDNPKNQCRKCHVLMPVASASRVCEFCQ